MNITLPPISLDVDEHHLFLASGEKNYTYRDLLSFADFFKELVTEYNIHVDHPIGLHTHSCDASIFIIASCWLYNIPLALFNPKAKDDTLTKQLTEIRPGLVITYSPDKKLSNHIPTIPIVRFDPLEKITRDHPLRSFSDLGPYHHPTEKAFGYFFTSGTSDEPKIVPLKRRQMHVAAKASAQNFKPKVNEAWLLCLPLHHIGGVSVILRSLLYGSAVYRIDRFDENIVSRLLSNDQQIVAASFVPTMLKRLLDDAGFIPHEAFKAILLGGGPIDTQLLKTCIDRHIPVIPSYGMTETCAQIAASSINSDYQNTRRLNSVGKIFSPNKIEIRNKNKAVVKARTSGTIWLKGPQVFDGYHNTSSQDSFDENGWFNTGDFGRRDTNGNLYIEARRTDLIITGGENVSPFEVESILKEMNFIKDAAVFGVPDSEWGQKVVAAVVFADGQNKSTEMIQEKLKHKLEPYKRPKKIIAVASLPYTETGKIKRSELSNHFKPQR
ncbi:MAG: AMP-binding protein [Balneolaceae bacterium]|nr:AMP-binding protein [Balneolaceae bacterium]